MPYPKRLIEVDLPIKRISVHARREKSIRHGHISTLHIWWARRPLAACRAVLCASLWLDPADPLCPKEFIEFAQKEMVKWSDNEHLSLLSKESIVHFIKVNHDKKLVENKTFLRVLLLDFIADFANWDNSNQSEFLNTSRAITQSAHLALGSEPGTAPSVLDPFAGGGSIPLEALRIGAEVFSSDLNPIPILINKVQLEYIPKYGKSLIKKYQEYAEILIRNAKKRIIKYYESKNTREEINAYFWARTIKCEGPGCGCEIPLLRNNILAKGKKSVYLNPLIDKKNNKIDFEIKEGPFNSKYAFSSVKRGNVVCPICGFTIGLPSVKKQLIIKNGGTHNCKLFTVMCTDKTTGKRYYRVPENHDIAINIQATIQYEKILKETKNFGDFKMSVIPNEDTSQYHSFVNRGPIYGMRNWSDYFTQRQLVLLTTLVDELNNIIFDKSNIKQDIDINFQKAIKTLLAFTIDRIADYQSSLVVWSSKGEFIAHTFGRQALPMVWEFPEGNIFSDFSGNWKGAVDWISRVIQQLSIEFTSTGSVEQVSATRQTLPDDFINLLCTDPPYYYSVQYSDLSDFFYVWLKRSLGSVHPELFKNEKAPKDDEIIVQSPTHQNQPDGKNKAYYESKMQLAMIEGRRILNPSGIAVIVFAHTSTSAWESQLQSMVNAGWTITGSWPIDTERSGRLISINRSVLASSVHLVCRPRENVDGSLIQNQIGDWRDVQQELPKRIHEWMPRLAAEGVAGADAIFACLGPALEIFSRYSSVEKPNGDVVTLREYLEKVWAAVSQEALNMVFTGGEAQGLEEDARLTAMWLWTLTAGVSDTGAVDDEDDSDDEESSTGSKLTGGFTLEYDTARKIAQGLGANLDDLKSLVEVKGDKARLLPVIERTSKLFGITGIEQQPLRRKKKEVQLTLSFESVESEVTPKYEIPELKVEQTGKTVLDRLHQAMLLFSTGRSEALKRFLVEDGAGKDDRFWKLAQSLTSLYPKDTDERRWVEAVQTYKKSLGF
jgi:putative DNA methylase